MSEQRFIPPHGGYRKLKSFQIAQLVYDITVRFVEKYVDRFSRMRDQMVQAARSGVQNIAEASQASGTLKETEIKLTNVARASLEELRLDYEDFLRQRNLEKWEQGHSLRQELVDWRCQTADEVARWIVDVSRRSGPGTDNETPSAKSILSTKTYPELSANAALVLLAVACSLLTRQLQTLEQDFLREGGLRERMNRARIQVRNRKNQPARQRSSATRPLVRVSTSPSHSPPPRPPLALFPHPSPITPSPTLFILVLLLVLPRP